MNMYFKYDRQNNTKCRKYMKIYMDDKYVLHDIINPDLTSVISHTYIVNWLSIFRFRVFLHMVLMSTYHEPLTEMYILPEQ